MDKRDFLCLILIFTLCISLSSVWFSIHVDGGGLDWENPDQSVPHDTNGIGVNPDLYERRYNNKDGTFTVLIDRNKDSKLSNHEPVKPNVTHVIPKVRNFDGVRQFSLIIVHEKETGRRNQTIFIMDKDNSSDCSQEGEMDWYEWGLIQWDDFDWRWGYVLHTIHAKPMTMPIDFILRYLGDIEGTFKFNLHANGTLIGNQTVLALPNGTSIRLNFTWDTSAVAFGNYTIDSYLSPLPYLDEANMSAGMNGEGWIFVTLAGDVDGDRDVDIFDIVRMALIYGVEHPDPMYDIDCDVDCDGDIDIFDIVMAATHYGESW